MFQEYIISYKEGLSKKTTCLRGLEAARTDEILFNKSFPHVLNTRKDTESKKLCSFI